MEEFFNSVGKITIDDILDFAARTNNETASYLLRFYGVENFDGSEQEYMELMEFLTRKRKVKNNKGNKVMA
jgi:hypothetical protein